MLCLGCAALREDSENWSFTEKDRAVLAVPARRLMGYSHLTQVEMSWGLADAAVSCAKEQYKIADECNAPGNAGV